MDRESCSTIGIYTCYAITIQHCVRVINNCEENALRFGFDPNCHVIITKFFRLCFNMAVGFEN